MAIQDHLSNSDKPSQDLFMLDNASASAFDISNNWPLLSQHQHHHHHHQFQDSPHPPSPRDPNFDRAIGFGIIPSNPRSITTHHQSTASAIDFDHLLNLQVGDEHNFTVLCYVYLYIIHSKICTTKI